MIGTLGEFLTCFKLIGYDLEGNPINMTVYKERIEKSALDNAFMEEIGKFMNSRMGWCFLAELNWVICMHVE